MKLKSKLVMFISSFCFVLTTCLFSVFAVKTFNFNIGGSIEFVAPGVEATVSAASLDGVSKKSGSGAMSTFTTTRGMSASDIAALPGVQSWSGIALLFDDDSEGQATISFTIKNNSSKDTENIKVSMSTNTTSSSSIQATPCADFYIAPGVTQSFSIALRVANPDVSALLSDFRLTVELKAVKTSEIPSMSEQQDSGLTFTPSATGNTASFTKYTGSSSTVEIPSVVQDSDGNIYTVTEIPDAETGEQSPFYSGKETITSIFLPATLTKIGSYAFYQCSKLTGDLTIPNGVKTIGNYAFRGCDKITGDLIIPNSVTTIGAVAFGHCSGFDGVLKIGNSIVTIGNSAFLNCSSFTSITIFAKNPPTLNPTIDLEMHCFYGTGSGKIYVPSESVDAYKTAQYWSVYADRIKPIA